MVSPDNGANSSPTAARIGPGIPAMKAGVSKNGKRDHMYFIVFLFEKDFYNSIANLYLKSKHDFPTGSPLNWLQVGDITIR